MAKKITKAAAQKAAPAKSGGAKRKPAAIETVVAKPRKAAKAPKVKEPAKAARTVVAAKPPVAAPKKPASRASHLDSKTLERIREMLFRMRERLTGQISALSDESLKYVDDSSSEDRTDDFDREFALNLVSTEQESVFEIDNALRRIKEGSYGMCDLCGCAIEKPRLQALPFARMCIKCQSAQEKGRTRFRPFGEALEQGVEQEVPEVVEPEENE